MESGSLADWFGAASTFAAFVGAVWAAHYARRAAEYAKDAIRIERARDDMHDNERRRAQAALVAAWPQAGLIKFIGGQVRQSFPGGSTTGSVTREDVAIVPERLTVTVRNGSPLPVGRFTFDLYVKAHDAPDWQYAGSSPHGLVPPDTTDSAEVMSPQMAIRMREVLAPFASARDTPPEIEVGCTFVDNAGVWWRHRHSGLTQIPDRADLRILSDEPR